MSDNRIQPITLAAILILLLMGYVLLTDQKETAVSAAAQLPADTPVAYEIPSETTTPDLPSSDPAEIRPPYDDYVITQGPHGESYGHLAIDLTAGKGASIYSPISGDVSALYIDEYGNPTLIIENEVWQVTLLHGDYTVSAGEQVSIGQVIGYESNHGYTVDWRGRSCRGRDCGYHIHLNLFDKRAGRNVNPLEVLEH